MILLCSGGDQQWEYWFMTLFHSGGDLSSVTERQSTPGLLLHDVCTAT